MYNVYNYVQNIVLKLSKLHKIDLLKIHGSCISTIQNTIPINMLSATNTDGPELIPEAKLIDTSHWTLLHHNQILHQKSHM